MAVVEVSIYGRKCSRLSASWSASKSWG